jgi:BASS family bile acid:Na+ symporter
MERVVIALMKLGPSLLALGVGVGLLWPWLAEQARPVMPYAVFVLVLGTLLRVDAREISATLRQPRAVVVLPLIAMGGCPLVVGALAHWAGLQSDVSVTLVLAAAAPPSSGNAAVARMLGLDPAFALVATFSAMALAPISIPLLAALFGGVSIDPFALAWRLAVLIGSAEGVALLLRHHAAALLFRYHTGVDTMVLAGLLVFALSTMAGMQARLLADPVTALTAVALAFAVNVALQGVGLLLPGSIDRRATMGLILGNRNVGLVWAVLGATVSPSIALFFAATQLPIYMLPRLLQAILVRLRGRSPARAPQPVGDLRCRIP